MRHANAGHNARGTDRTRANADFDSVRTGVGQSDGRITGRNVAANDLQGWEILFNPAHAIQYALGVPVSGVHHHHVQTVFSQGRNTVLGVRAGAHRCTHQQLTLRVSSGVGEVGSLDHVFQRDHAFQFERFVDDQDLFNAVFMQLATDFLVTGALKDSHQTLARGHHLTDRRAAVVLKTDITAGHDADQLIALDHGQATDAITVRQGQQFTHRAVWRHGVGIVNHATFVLFDLTDFLGLAFDRQILVHNAHAALLGHSNRQAGFGDGVHGGGQHWDVECNGLS